ncbi:hypothetical protein [Agarivorans sp. DSG3-1]|uniref:hypothetical protein n=1 Tax=Agarivorans sp. DSG3-1 TaxID=3342249 RepID=UPI00398F1CE9
MELKDAIHIYQTHYSQIDLVWGYFSTVSIAILGFTLGTERITQKKLEFRAVQFGYLIFSMGNFSALYSGQSDLIKINNFIILLQVDNELVIDFSPIGLMGLSSFYWAVVASMLIGLQYVYKSRIRP